MEQKNIPHKKKIKVELRPSPRSLKIALTVLILLSIAALTALRWVHLKYQQETQALINEAAAVQYENDKLTQRTGNLGSVDSIEAIAREELGMVDPETILIDPK